MKRRKFIRYGTLSATSILLNTNISLNQHSDTSSYAATSKGGSYDWVFLYWMPYDNNLAQFSVPIIQMLQKGVQTENILVVVVSDLPGAKNLSRNIIAKNNIDVQKIDSINSSSEEVFAEYLNWAKSQFKTNNWAIVFLGHGGSLDTISPDDNPGLGLTQKTQWMNIKKLSDIIAKFNQEVSNRVELVFFQNCNKGTIEAHYTFQDTAKYTLSSQILLGAPNYYYDSLFQFLGYNPNINGGELAKKIIEFERSDMYHSYTVTKNSAIKYLPAKINPLIESIIASKQSVIKLSNLSTFYYMGDRYVDTVSFFSTLKQQSIAATQHYNEFIDFLNNSMIYSLNQKGNLLGRRAKSYRNLSGLNIFLPKNIQEFKKYAYLTVFSDLKLGEIFKQIAFA